MHHRFGKSLGSKSLGSNLHYSIMKMKKPNQSLKLTPLSCVVFKFSDSLFILFLFVVLSAIRVRLA